MEAGLQAQAAGEASESQDEVLPVELEDLSPLEYMLRVMNSPEAQPERRDRMAIAAAPFVHPRAGEAKKGKKDEKAERAAAAATGRFAPPAPPRLN